MPFEVALHIDIKRLYHVDTEEQAKVLFAEDVDNEYDLDTLDLRDFIKVEKKQ